MIGCILFGGVLGLFALKAHRHCHGGRGSWRRGARRRGGGGFLRSLADELDLTGEQRDLVKDEIGALRDQARPMKKEWKRSRGDVADAMRADDFDAEMMGDMFARHDDALRDARMAVVGALAKIHAALEPGQRARLADLMSSRGHGGWSGGPYRGWA